MPEKNPKKGGDSDSDSEAEDHVAELHVEKSKNLAARSRVSVSAEAFGKYNKKEAYKAVVIPKP